MACMLQIYEVLKKTKKHEESPCFFVIISGFVIEITLLLIYYCSELNVRELRFVRISKRVLCNKTSSSVISLIVEN